MAGDFDYDSFWENARDALDALDNLGNAMHQFLAMQGTVVQTGHRSSLPRRQASRAD